MQAFAHAQQQALAQACQTLANIRTAGRQQLRSRRRCGRAHIGDEVGDGYVGLVADGADDRRLAGGHGTGDGLFVEAPEVFQRTAATRQDQRIEAATIGQFDGTHDLWRRLAALDGGGHQCQRHMGRSAAEHGDDVANHRASRRADDADPLRMGRQGTFAGGVEQALGGELFLQRLEGQAQGAIAGRLQRVENQLVIAAPLEQRDLASHLDGQAVAQRLAHPGGVLAEQCAAYLGVLVLEREIDVAGGGAGEVGDFTFDPDLGEHVFQQQPGAAVELADGEDLAVEIQALEGIVEHGRHDKRWRRGAAKSRRTAAVIGAAPYHSPFLRGRSSSA